MTGSRHVVDMFGKSKPAPPATSNTVVWKPDHVFRKAKPAPPATLWSGSRITCSGRPSRHPQQPACNTVVWKPGHVFRKAKVAPSATSNTVVWKPDHVFSVAHPPGVLLSLRGLDPKLKVRDD